MDRCYKAFDTVAVYEGGERIDTTSAQPYSRAGFDWYPYKGGVYPAYVNRDTGEIFIDLECE